MEAVTKFSSSLTILSIVPELISFSSFKKILFPLSPELILLL